MKCKIIDYDANSDEASIEFSEDNISIFVYCPYLENPRLNNKYELTAFLPDNIMRTCNELSIIKTDNGFYSYCITAKLIERINNICKVDVKGLIIRLENVPNDIETLDNVGWFTNLVKKAVNKVVSTVKSVVNTKVKVLSTSNGAIGTVCTLAACAVVGAACAFIPGGQIVTATCASIASAVVGSVGFNLTATF